VNINSRPQEEDTDMTEEKKKKQHKEEKPLEKMTVKDLREIALEIPHDHVKVAVRDMKKDELVSFIKEARGIVDEAPEKKKKKVAVKAALTKPKIKEKIKALKQEKKSAQDAKEKKKVEILRRRINKLKKQTRKIA
jgi:hypothetical protein